MMKALKACLLGSLLAPLALQTTYADLLVDRGLPSSNVNNSDWSLRSNIGAGDYDAKDPLWSENNWGTPEIPGDDFTLPSTASTYQITDIRVWLDPENGASSYSAAFYSVVLMLGQGTGTDVTLTALMVTPTETDVTFPGTSVSLWQLDFPVNFTAPGGTGYSFAIYADGKPCDNASGNGESYYVAFMEAVMVGDSSGYPNDSSDGYVKDFYIDGTYCDEYTFNQAWGVPNGDFNVQVFGTAVPVPEPGASGLAVIGGALLLGFTRVWRKS